jgi:hypothetical protein
MKARNGLDTPEYTLPPAAARVLPPADISARVQVDLAALSHQGKVRTNNEDHFLVSRVERSLETVVTNLPTGAYSPEIRRSWLRHARGRRHGRPPGR